MSAILRISSFALIVATLVGSGTGTATGGARSAVADGSQTACSTCWTGS